MNREAVVKYYWGISPHSIYTDILTKDLTVLEDINRFDGSNDANWDEYEDILESSEVLGEHMFYLVRHFSPKWCLSQELWIEINCSGQFDIAEKNMLTVSYLKYIY